MKLFKIKSPFIHQQLFSFISTRRKLNIIKYNFFLNQKLELSQINYKEFFFQQKMKKYENYSYICNYWLQFQNDFKNIIEKNSYQIFLNSLSKLENFILKLTDKDFKLMINNIYFKENVRIDLENMYKVRFPKMILIKEGQLIDKIIKILKEIFDLFSTNGKMSKEQSLEFMERIKIHNYTNEIKKLFSYDIDKDGFLLYEEFENYYYDLIKNNLRLAWNNINNLGYNNFLAKNGEYDLNYLQNHLNEFEESILSNFFQIINKKINKICLCSKIDKKYIDYLNKQLIFNQLKQIDISISNLKIFICLNILCPNIQELNLFINENFEYNINEIINILPNILTLKIHFHNNFDLIDLLRNLNNSKIENLQIFDKNNEYKYIQFKSKIILPNIKILKIDGNYEIFIQLFNNIQLPNLYNYQFFFNNIKDIEYDIKINYENNSILSFLIKIMKKGNNFYFNDFIYFSNSFKFIKYFQINLNIYSFICDNENNYFEFKLYDENEFKNYYSNYDFSIDEKEVSKYKKIKIEGLIKLNTRKDYNIEIIEGNKNINLCDINFNIEKLYIKSLKDIKSIYCEEEIQNTNLFSIIEYIINENGFQKLKYINLTIGYIKENPNNNLSDNHIYNYLSKFIKSSINLKCLILRLHPNNYQQNILFFLSLIENLKKLKQLNISSYKDIYENDLNENNLLNKFPKLKERLDYFDEFKIKNKKNYIESIYDIKPTRIEEKIKLFNYIIQDYNNIFCKNENEEMKEYIEIYLNEQKIDLCYEYKFNKEGNNTIKMNYKRNLTNIKRMFYDCSSLIDLNLSNFNNNNIINMSYMFSNCCSLKNINLSNLNTYNVTNMSNMFFKCASLTSLDLSNLNTYNVTNMSNMFEKCCSLTSLNISNFNTSNVINMSRMFFKCSSLKFLNISNFNTYKVIDMVSMFSKCFSLITLDLSNFNTNNVINMREMFYNCYSMNNLNLSSFNTNKVTDMSRMFYKCVSLTSLNLSNFNTNNIISMKYMFFKCSSLNYLNILNFNTNKLINMIHMFDEIPNNCKVIKKNE